MERELDPRMQQILNQATSYATQNAQVRSFSYSSGVERPESRLVDWSFASAPRQMPQEPAAFDRARFQPTTQQPMAYPNTGIGRLSLPPRNTFSQPESDLRFLSNTDNHFRFAKNLREGAPLSQPQAPRQGTMRSVNTIDHISNPMSMPNTVPVLRSMRSMPQPQSFEQEMSHGLNSHTSGMFSQLQPRKQQIAPPFNLSGFSYSPEARISLPSSSPMAGPGSSPTVRADLRRVATRTAASPTETFEQSVGPAGDDVFTAEGSSISQISIQPPQPVDYDYRGSDFPSISSQKSLIPIRDSSNAPHAFKYTPPMAHGIQLISPHQLPDRLRHVFPYELFNAAQSKCFGPIYKNNDNVVVSAPTGSGKTAILELAICKVVEGYQSGTFKIVYLAPIKSLCSERLRDWTSKFSHLNLSCAELTGDTHQGEMQKVRDSAIIVTTPEKWDSITRKWSDHAKLVQMVRLFLIDEVHILKDPRGATLEAIVSRMKKMSADVRFVALSATIPNSQDIATWLGKDHTSQHLPAHRETFGESFRPVQLSRYVHGFDGLMNDYAFEKLLDSKITGLITKYTHKKPIMVFCYTRKSCEHTAALLAGWWSKQRDEDRAWPTPKQKVRAISRDLADLLDCGVAYHHAGLDGQDRHAVETGFLGGNIGVICCTSTLAVGVNLPCHLVVLKGTVGFQDGKLSEYSDLEVMQMLGRAGRPQFDDSAIAVIMTRSERVKRYEKLISGQDTLESTLHLNFIELLNSEISLGTVKNVYEAKVWLNGTFLSVRMRQNPNYYRIDGVDAEGDTDQRLEQACERDVKLLQEYNLVTSQDQFACTEYGEAMSRYMVRFETMKLLLSIPEKATTGKILEVVCQAAEFKELKVRPNERPILREFNKSAFIKFPITETVTTTAHKVLLMIQVQLGGIDLPNEKEFNIIKRQFVVETAVIFERVQRLMRCIIDCKLMDEDSVAIRHGLDLARSLSAGFWEYSNLQLRQIQQVGSAAVRKLVGNNINSVEKLDEKDAGSIERIMSKNPPFGKKMKDNLAAFPRLELSSEIIGKAQLKQGNLPKVNIKAVLGYRGARTPVWGGKKPSLTFMAETTGGRLVHFWRGNIMKLDRGLELRFSVELANVDDQIKCWLACDDIVGTVKTCILKHDIAASHFPPPPPAAETEARKFAKGKETKRLLASYDFGDDDLSDGDLLAAVQNVENDTRVIEVDDASDGVGDIGITDRNAQQLKGINWDQESDDYEPARMANGRYICQHVCHGGQLLKNGNKCKHRCCLDGLDKPPVRKRKRTTGEMEDEMASQGVEKRTYTKRSGSNSSKKKKISNQGSATKFKTARQLHTELKDAEHVELPDERPPTTYASRAPREYRKLQSLHTGIQKEKDNSLRVLKNLPKNSYGNGTRAELPFMKDKHSDEEFGDFSDEDFPSIEQLSGIPDFGSGSKAIMQTKGGETTFDDTFIGVMNNSIAEMDQLAPPADIPAFRQSFADGMFDFNVFDDFDDHTFEVQESPNEKTTSTPLGSDPTIFGSSNETPMESTRQSSLERDIEEVQHRRVSQAEQAKEFASSGGGDLPDWVNELDPDLFESLRGYVDFVD